MSEPDLSRALEVLLDVAGGPAHREGAVEAPPRRVRWCEGCGAPLDLGRRECPGCRLLEESRVRVSAYLARHGMPAGGPVELARAAGVPLRAVGEMMVPPDRRRRPPRPLRGRA